jgi:hypothetical protein
MKSRVLISLLSLLAATAVTPSVFGINGGTLRVFPRNGWKAFEVISYNDNPNGYAMLDTFDGVGAWLPDVNTLRVQVNHETSDAAVSETNLNLANFQTVIRKMIDAGTTGGVAFVTSARQAYDQWTANDGTNWTTTNNNSTTSFSRFCASQSYVPNTFGPGRGFVDHLYITGEEITGGRLFAIDSANRDFYQLSRTTGGGTGGIFGMPFDAWENASLLDTGETNYVALLLSPDGGTQTMQLYIGQKGRNAAGLPSTSFLARNGLAYGSYYYLNDTLPTSGTSTDGFIDTTMAGALVSAKLEDVDTNPNDPTQAVIGIQETGLFSFDFNLDFSGGTFNAPTSNFSITKLQNHNNDLDGQFGDADNVDWTAATSLGGTTYADGLIFVNEDSGTGNGETWMTTSVPGGTRTLIADTVGSPATETSGVLDISSLVGFRPGSILLTTNQGSTVGSLTVLINPNATLAGDFNGDGTVDAADYVYWRAGGETFIENSYAIWRSQFGQTPGSAGTSAAAAAGVAIPEPATAALVAALVLAIIATRWPFAMSFGGR